MSYIQIPEPKLSQFLFSDTRLAALWLLVRLYVGYEWFMAGWGKFNNPAWVGENAGKAIRGFFIGALGKVSGPHPDVSSWYAYFLNNIAMSHTTFFSYLITFGELAVGAGLILGAMTGVAAFFGAFMNLNFLFAGTVSTNPSLLLLQLFLILAWRNAGWLGADRWLLVRLGVLWRPGSVFRAPLAQAENKENKI